MPKRPPTHWPETHGMSSPVRWTDVAATVRAVADSSDGGLDTVARLVIGFTEPLRQLDKLAELTARALKGDALARRDVRAAVAALRRRKATPVCGEEDDCHCGCAENPPLTADVSEQPAGQSLLNSAALIDLSFALAWLHADQGVEAGPDVMDVVINLAGAAGQMAILVEDWKRAGAAGVAARINELGAAGRLAWLQVPAAPVLMQTLNGEMPGIPGIPGLPGLPGGWRPPKTIDDIIGKLTPWKPKWDDDDWCPTYPWWQDQVNLIDPRITRLFACISEAKKKMAARAAISPPARPTPAVWSTGITSVDVTNACAGQKIVIRGANLPPRATTVVLFPTADGCRPVTVAAADWTATAITVVIPATAISGPVGFADAAYVTAYDAWAAQQNRLADEIRALGCAMGTNLPWVPPFRECPPDAGVNKVKVGAPIIDAFTANGATVAVVEPGQTIELGWTVRNTTSVRVSRVSGAGPTFGGATALDNPSTATYLLAAPTYNTPQEYRYRITATGPCASASITREVTVVATRRPALSIGGVEVTQGIQNAANTVRLVESKPTVVRVTVRHGLAGWGGDTVPNVRGRIRVYRSNGWVSPWFDAANGSSPMAANPGSSITVVASPQRNNTDDTLNFLIPPLWNAESASYRIEVRVAGFGATAAFAGFDDQAAMNTARFSFQRRRTMELRYIPVKWGGSTPSAATCDSTLRGAVPLLPTPTANIWQLPVGIPAPSTDDDGRDDLLDDFDDRHNCSIWEALTEWLGSDCPDDDGAIWVLIPGVFYRGRSYDIPSNVCFTPPSDGPYAAHEISHCLNQQHVSVMCANGQQATGGDAPGAWPNNAQLVDVPFDVTRNRALTLSGTGVFDVMTYCGSPNNTWPMPVRWDRLWDQVGG